MICEVVNLSFAPRLSGRVWEPALAGGWGEMGGAGGERGVFGHSVCGR